MWLETLGPVITGVATVLVAALVGWIGWRQWRTEHAKLALDLFDRRMQIYSDAYEAIRLIAANGGAKNNDANVHALRAWRSSTFLFQKDVRDRLEGLVDQILAVRAAEEMMEAPEDEASRQSYIKTKWDGVKAIAKMRNVLAEDFAPYMRMDHKM